MKITVEFLSLPNVAKMAGARVVTVEFPGETVHELIQELCARYGESVRQFLLDETGQLDMSLSVSINRREWIRRDHMNRKLKDGDRVAVMMLVAGG